MRAGGSWTIARLYDASPRFEWDMRNLAPGTYYAAVWMKVPGSSRTVPYDAASQSFTLVRPGPAPMGKGRMRLDELR
jgi:hypothetical protein